jgi:haloacid dehalogenase-like hydrolase
MPSRATAAIVYDFDGTLSPGSMQEHSLLPKLGYATPAEFWKEVKQECRARDGDEVLTYMELLLRKGAISQSEFRSHGSKLPLFVGADTWFERMNKRARELELKLEHYVVSSGIREMIEGSSIYSEFTRVFASSFAYDADGNAIWPSVAINYTTKTQFLFRINKGISNTWDNEAVNRWMPMEDRPIPFQRMIFLGDGDTDIPAMKMLRFQGGIAIAVFDPKKWQEAGDQGKIEKLIAEDRASYVAPADYTDGSQLDVTVRGVLGRIAREAGYRP